VDNLADLGEIRTGDAPFRALGLTYAQDQSEAVSDVSPVHSVSYLRAGRKLAQESSSFCLGRNDGTREIARYYRRRLNLPSCLDYI
jgi:hypothetical protein